MVRRAPAALARWVGAVVLAGAVGAIGTGAHRAFMPWGIAAALALVLAAAVLVRAWAGLVGLLGYGIGWVVVVQLLSLTGPGGDVLIAAGQPVGYVWIVGGMLMVAAAAFAPRRWFRDHATVAGQDPRPRASAPSA